MAYSADPVQTAPRKAVLLGSLLHRLPFHLHLLKEFLYENTCITQTCPCNILRYFMAVKIVIFW